MGSPAQGRKQKNKIVQKTNKKTFQKTGEEQTTVPENGGNKNTFVHRVEHGLLVFEHKPIEGLKIAIIAGSADITLYLFFIH